MDSEEKELAPERTKPALLQWSRLWPYVFAFLAGGLSLAARMILTQWGADRPFLVAFCIPIILSAYFGGLGPGLLSTAVVAVGTDYYFIEPRHSVFMSNPELEVGQWLFLVVSGVLASFLSEALHRARRQADAGRRLYAVTLESIGDAVITTDDRGRINFLNNMAEFLTGWTNAVAVGQPLPKVFHIVNGLTGAVEENPIEQVFRTGSMVSRANHSRLISRTGQEYFIEDSAAPIRRADGQVVGVVLVFRDNTDNRKAEAALRESEARLSKIFHSRQVGIVVTRFADGLILQANEAYADIYGYTVEEVLGRTPLELGMYADPSQREQILQSLESNGSCPEQEIRFRRKNGTEGFLILSLEILQLADEKCLLGMLRNISEQKQAQEKFLREQARFKLIFDTVPIGISVRTIHGDGTTASATNNAYLSICGLTREELEAPGVHARITSPEDLAVQQQFQEQVEAGRIKQYSLEKRHLHPDGKTVWVNFTYQREVHADGTVEELTAIVDITERKRLEEQLRQSQKMEAIGQLAAGVAHDFNNILTVIQSYATLLITAETDPKMVAESVQQISGAVKRGAGLTRQLLIFGRKQIIRPSSLDLNDIVSNMTKMLRRIVGEDVALQSEYSPNLPPIYGDAGMMEQIILNLAVNARDAMPGGGRLVISTGIGALDEQRAREIPDAKPGQHVYFSVTDTGSGIAPEHLPRIFEPFFTTKEVGKGTGLGLATVYGIAQQHQGWITVKSSVNRGTTFRVCLPPYTGNAAAKPEHREVEKMPGGNETLLVVEDEGPLRLILCTALERCGYHIYQAASGLAALEVWQEHKHEIQLLLTDMVMPHGINGRELASRLLAEKPELRVIYCSGYISDRAGQDLPLDEGVNFLQKPFNLLTLARTVRDSLDRP